MHMRESRVIALAGVFQATSLVRQIATKGRADEEAIEVSLSSIFRIDAASAVDVFGGIAGLRRGLQSLIVQLDNENAARDLDLTRLTLGVLRMQRQLSGKRGLNDALGSGIEAIQRQVTHLGVAHPTILGRLAELYSATLSQLRPRLMVHGEAEWLRQTRCVEQIRALLLAAVRAAVLWRQVGGRQWRLLLRRREYAMLARGMLTSSTLDRG
ncbi:MAG: high frequency lysogenization protein HflD [Rhodanobacteraceae bacterium]